MNTTSDANYPPSPTASREEQSHFLVLICGLFTSGLALSGVYVLDRSSADFQIMGWYANYVLPVGALIVGAVAASGYGLASWLSGIKITRGLLWMVLILQVACYFGAQYIQFAGMQIVHQNGKPITFFEYFDFAARNFAWKERDGSMGQPLGVWGYFFRGLEVLGFAGGGVFVPFLLRKKPYCDSCRRYMRTRTLGYLPASIPVKKVKKSDEAGLAAYQAEQEQAATAGQRSWERLQQLAGAGKASEFQTALGESKIGPKQAIKLPRRLSLHLSSCRRCMSGALLARMVTGQGNQVKQTEFGRTELHPDFVRSLQPPPTGVVVRPLTS
jgi:hypothetical protein